LGKRHFVIFDRDGTLIEDRHYLSDPKEVRLIEGVGECLCELTESGFGLVVVSNQSGIGRGYFTREDTDCVNERMCDLLAASGAVLSGIYFCPHTPEAGCKCRKPGTALVEEAVADLGFNPGESIVVGDRPCDIELGRQVGATSILVRTGYGRQIESSVAPDYVADNLRGAIPFILDLYDRAGKIGQQP